MSKEVINPISFLLSPPRPPLSKIQTPQLLKDRKDDASCRQVLCCFNWITEELKPRLLGAHQAEEGGARDYFGKHIWSCGLSRDREAGLEQQQQLKTIFYTLAQKGAIKYAIPFPDSKAVGPSNRGPELTGFQLRWI